MLIHEIPRAPVGNVGATLAVARHSPLRQMKLDGNVGATLAVARH
jgi:hypothetical protein